MKHIKNVLTCFLLSLMMIACSQKQTESDRKIQEALPILEKQAGTFDPSIGLKTQGTYRSVKVVLDSNGAYHIDTAMISLSNENQLLQGFSLDSSSSLPFAVVWLNESGKPIGGYNIEHPLLLRSCEEGKEETRIMKQGSFEIVVPENVSSVQLNYNKRSLARIKLS